jgi:hypothetical protein
MATLNKLLFAALALLALVLGLLFLLNQLQFFYLFHAHLPVRDTLRIVPLVQQVLDYDPLLIPLAEWVQPHAGAHRIVLTRLLMTLDFAWFGGRNHLIYASTAFSLFLLLAIYSRAIIQLSQGHGVRRAFLAGLGLLFLFSPSLSWNLVSPINASWYTALAFSVAATWLILSAGDGVSMGRLWLAYSCALLAAASNFSGSLVWLILPIALALRGSVWAKWCAGLALLFFWLYLPQLAEGTMRPASLDALLHIGRSLIIYLGSPLSRQYPLTGSAVALLSIIFLAYAWLVQLQEIRRREAAPSAARLLVLTMATLCLGIALATQLGRVIFSQPDALRYQNVVMLYWLNICCLVLSRVPRDLLAMPIAALVVVALVILPLSAPLPRATSLIKAALETEREAVAGVPNRKTYATLLPLYSRDVLAEQGNFLQQRQLALFNPRNAQRQDCGLRLLLRERAAGSSVRSLQQQLLPLGACPWLGISSVAKH